MKNFILLFTVTFIGAFLLLQGGSAPKAEGCRTPDGFLAHNGRGMGGTGIGNGKGVGGTGLDDGKGVGGTGIYADIGVYGRITAWGSICVNGMHIHYKSDTPVRLGNKDVTAADLRIGQVVAVQTREKDGEYIARRISIQRNLSGRVSRVDEEKGEITVDRKTVIIGKDGNAILKTLKRGDFVAVSGLRRADGVVVAGYIEKTATQQPVTKDDPKTLFGKDAKFFSIQGYVHKHGGQSQLILADGARISFGEEVSKAFAQNDRVIIMGEINSKGAYIAGDVVIEHADFTSGVVLPVLEGKNIPALELEPLKILPGKTGKGDLPPLHDKGDKNPDLPPVDLPPVDVPPVDLPALPPVDLPPIELPELPPVELDLSPVKLDLPVVPDIDIDVPGINLPLGG